MWRFAGSSRSSGGCALVAYRGGAGEDDPRGSMMREIVIDTETTGLDPQAGHRIVEIACVELAYHVPTGRVFHCYVDPERDMPEDALGVPCLTAEFLRGHQPFATIADELLEYIGDARLVIHNAEFDLAFLNAELSRLGR